jgi:hypothetical protein
MKRLPVVLAGVGLILLTEVVNSDPALRSRSQTAAADNPRDELGDNTPPYLPVTGPEFKKRSSFSSDDDYGQYVKNTLRVGYRVRAIVDYQSVTKGMTGTYYGTHTGTPPCLIIWDKNLNSGSKLLPNVPPDKARHAYWVFWPQIEILDIQP